MATNKKVLLSVGVNQGCVFVYLADIKHMKNQLKESCSGDPGGTCFAFQGFRLLDFSKTNGL